MSRKEGLPYYIDLASRFCAYRERCRKEVAERLRKESITKAELDEVLEFLETEDILNEQRYAYSFVQGKFRQNKWGRNKIRFALKINQISTALIESSLNAIDEKNYVDTLEKLFDQHLNKEGNLFENKQRTSKYLYNKGFETELIHMVADLYKEDNNA